MRANKTRSNDSTFDLNLAPFLDIIVSVIPMLLLSIAFIQVKMIESPVPQVVSEKNLKEPPKPEMTIILNISNKKGFEFAVTDIKGKTTITKVALADGQLDYETLFSSAVKIKQAYPNISSLQLSPDPNVSFDDIVKVMDKVRKNNTIKENLFPDVTFASVGG